MTDGNQKPTLQDLARQLLRLHENLGYILCVPTPSEWKKRSETIEELTQSWLEIVAELLVDIHEAKKTAIATGHPAAFCDIVYMEDYEIPIYTFRPLDDLSEKLEAALDHAVGALGEQREYEDYPERLPPKHRPPLQRLFEDLRSDDLHMEKTIDTVEEVANALAGIFLKEQMESEQDAVPDKEPSEVHDEWIRVSEAAEIAHVKPGTISRLVKERKIESNGKRGPDRRITRSSVLLWMEERKDRERRKGYKEYQQTLDDIPDKH